MTQLNTARIAETMREMAEDLRSRAEAIERHAQELEKTGDLDEAVAALSAAVSTQNLDVGRLLNRTVREIYRSHEAPQVSEAHEVNVASQTKPQSSDTQEVSEMALADKSMNRLLVTIDDLLDQGTRGSRQAKQNPEPNDKDA